MSISAAWHRRHRNPERLRPYNGRLLGEIAESNQAELRWHVAQMVPRLTLSRPEERKTVELLLPYLDDDSRIVKVSSMQALADLAIRNPLLELRVELLVRRPIPDLA